MNMIDRLVLLISKRNGRFHHARGMHRNRRIVLEHIAQHRNRLPYVYLGAYGQGASLLRGGQAQYGPRTDGEAGGRLICRRDCNTSGYRAISVIMENMSEAIIRTLRKDDYPALIDLVRRTWYAEYDERTGLLAAEADWENCLARVTTAFVAELEDKPVASICGRIDELDHRSPLEHAPALIVAQAIATGVCPRRHGSCERDSLGTLHVDRQLRKQAANIGHEYSAEVVLFVLDPGGARSWSGPAHVRDDDERIPRSRHTSGFLFTDTTCDVGFYVHRGLTQVCEQSLPASGPGETRLR